MAGEKVEEIEKDMRQDYEAKKHITLGVLAGVQKMYYTAIEACEDTPEGRVDALALSQSALKISEVANIVAQTQYSEDA